MKIFSLLSTGFWLYTVTLITCATAFGADTPIDSFKNGKISGKLETLYVSGSDTDVPVARSSDNKNVASGAVELNYVTEEFKGVNLGLGFQSGHDFDIHDYDGSSEDDSRNSISATMMHQAYLQYSAMASSVKVGRQIIKTPLLLNSSEFPLTDSFDGVTLTTKLIPKTMLQLFYIKEFNKRNGSDSDGSWLQEDTHFDDGFYSLYLKNQSISGLSLDGQFQMTNDDTNGDLPVIVLEGYNQYFLRSEYKMPFDFPLFLGLLYGGATFDKAAEPDTMLYGIKLGTIFGPAKISLAYTSVDDDNDFPGTLGHAPDTILYTSMLITDAIYAGVDAVSLQTDFDFGIKNLERACIQYTHFAQSDAGMANSPGDVGTADEVRIDLKYKFSAGYLKNLALRMHAAYAKYDQDVPQDDIVYGRFYVTYTF